MTPVSILDAIRDLDPDNEWPKSRRSGAGWIWMFADGHEEWKFIPAICQACGCKMYLLPPEANIASHLGGWCNGKRETKNPKRDYLTPTFWPYGESK